MNKTPQTIIERLEVKNYRSLVDVDVPLGSLTVLVGRNSAGKSNTIDVLRFVRDAVSVGLDQALLTRHGFNSLRSRLYNGGQGEDAEVHLWLRGEDWVGEYEFSLGSEGTDSYQIKHERVSIHSADEQVEYEAADGKLIKWPEKSDMNDLSFEEGPHNASVKILSLPAWGAWTFAVFRLLHFLRNMSFYSINPDYLRLPQYPASGEVLGEKGENLASVLRRLKQQNNQRFSGSLSTALSRIIEETDDYSVQQIGGLLATRLQHTSDVVEQELPFYLVDESDGTLRVLGILTALYQDPPRPLLTIEEPELNIHPGALEVLCDVIQEASLRSQVIVTTHSPDLVSHFPADALRVVEKVDGVTHIGRISETQYEAVTENLFTPGALMRIEGLRRSE
jgi:predicted ATPase